MKTDSAAPRRGTRRGRAGAVPRWHSSLAMLPLACAVLAGCGGGGDDGAPAPPPPINVSVAPRIEAASAGSDITVANYQTFAPALAQTVLTGMQSGFVGADIAIGTMARRMHPLASREKALESQFYALTPKTGERFVAPSTGGPPSAGRMWMQDATGDALEIKSQSSTLVDFSFYPSGSSTPSATWLGQPWSAFQ